MPGVLTGLPLTIEVAVRIFFLCTRSHLFLRGLQQNVHTVFNAEKKTSHEAFIWRKNAAATAEDWPRAALHAT